MTRHAVFGQVAAVTFAVGCLALTAVSQQETQPGARPRPAADTPQRTGNVNFFLYSDCKGKEVTSQNGEEIGTFENAIVERGSHRAKFFVIDADNRMTAVPFHAFRWDEANDQFMLTVGPDQLRTMPEFDENRWDQLATTRDTNDPLVQALMRESSWPQRDPYLTGDQASLETIALRGDITRVEHRDMDGMGEEIILHVRSDSFGEDGRPGMGNEPRRPTAPPRGNSDPDTPDDPAREPGAQDRPGAAPDRPQTPGTTRSTTPGNDVKVALGPSWYVMSRADVIPMRGHSFDGEVAQLERPRGDVKYVAISCRINGKDLQLRDPNTKQPLWLFGAPMDRPAAQPRTTDPNRPTHDPNLDDEDDDDTSRRPGAGDPAGTGGNPTMPPGERPERVDDDDPQDRPGTTRPATQDRPGMTRTGSTQGRASIAQAFYLLSELEDSDVQFRGEAGGKIKDCVLERNSGMVAFFAVDPDENFLGIGDETRLIPAQLVYVSSDDKVHIDATKEMLEQSIELPDDVNALQQQYQQVYRTFELEAPKFQPARPRTGGTVTDPNRPATDRPTDRPGSNRPGERPNDRP